MMSQNEIDLLVVGELNVDLILDRIGGQPQMGKEQIARDMTLTLGSSSAIFASNSASLGSSVAFAGWIGDDHFGHVVTDSLASGGVDTEFISRHSSFQTGVTVAFNVDQERMMVTHPGAMEHMSLQDLPVDQLKRFRHLHVSSIFLQPSLKPGLVDLFSHAREAGLTTSLDTQWDPDEQWDLDLDRLLSSLDYFLPNEKEFCNLTGTKSVDDAVKRLPQNRGTVVVKMGTNGALLIRTDGSREHEPACHLTEFADAIGAGDSFDAGFIRARLMGWEDRQSLRFANLCGAVSTTASGGTTAIESFEQILETGTATGYPIK